MAAFLARSFFLGASLAAAACAGPAQHEVPAVDPGRLPSAAASTSAPRARLPNLELHCTPQGDDDVAACSARGAGYHVGPPLICRGVDVGPEVRASERKAYDAGVNPCTCLAPDAERECAMVP